MTSSACDAVAFDVHEANSRLTFWLNSLVLSRADTPAVTPEQMAALLSELMRAGEWMRNGQPQSRTRDVEETIREYRGQLERIRDLLPTIHRQLLAERARIESERSRVKCAAAWAQASRRTF